MTHRWPRVLLWLFAAPVVLVTLVLAVITLCVRTEWGRRQLASLALDVANETLPGTLSLDALDRIDPWGVALGGLTVRDPQARTVARVGRFEAALEPWALLHGQLLITRVALADAEVDLRDLDAEDRGLLAALVPDSADETPEPETGEPLAIDVERIALRDIGLHVELPGRGPVEVQGLQLAGSFHMRTHMYVALDALSAQVTDGEGHSLDVGPVSAVYRDDGEPCRIALEADSGSTRIELVAALVPPPASGYLEAPVSLRLEVARLDEPLLSLLGLREALAGVGLPLSARLNASGSLQALRADLQVTTPGGDLHARAQMDDLDAVKLSLGTERLALQRVHEAAPASVLGLSLSAQTRLAEAPDSLPVSLRIDEAELDGRALPGLRAQLSLRDRTVRLERLELTGQGVDARLSGRYGLDDGRLSVQGDVHGQSLQYAEFRVGRLEAHLEAKGKLPLPRIDVKVDLRELHTPDLDVEHAGLVLEGGPEDYTLALNAAAKDARIALEGNAQRHTDYVMLSLAGGGELFARPFSLDLRDLRVGMDGSVSVPHLQASALGQSARLEGDVTSVGQTALQVEARALDLGALSNALELSPPLVGQADLRLNIGGSVEMPHVVVSLHGRGVGLRDGPAHHANLDLELAPQRHKLESRVTITSEQLGKLSLSVDATLARRGPLQARLMGGEYHVKLASEGFQLGYVEATVPEVTLPVTGHADLTVALDGPLQGPVLSAALRGEVTHVDSTLRAQVSTDLAYEPGAARLEVEVVDSAGPWAKLQAELEPGTKRTFAWLESLPELAHVAHWKADLAVEPRALRLFETLVSLPEELADTTLGLKLTAEHAPRAEPEIELVVQGRVPASKAASARCTPLATEVSLRAQLSEANATLEVLGDTPQGRWLSLQASADAALTPVLATGAALDVQSVSYALEAEDLNLSHVPLACSEIYGELSVHSKGEDLLGPAPRVSLEVVGREFGFSRRSRIGLRAEATLTPDALDAEAHLTSGDQQSDLSAHLPMQLVQGVPEPLKDAPLSADVVLRKLALRPLIAPSMPISRVSGHVEGDVHVRGSLAAPRVKGQLTLQDVRLTANSLAQPLHDINGRLDFDETQVRIRKLRAHDGDGHITVDGTFDLPRDDRAALALVVEAKDFPLRQQGQIAADTNLHAEVTAQMDGSHTKAKVVLRDVDMWLHGGESRGAQSLDLHPDIEDPRVKPAEPEPASDEPARTLMLILDAQDHFWVKRDDFAVKLSSQLEMSVVEDGVHVQGAATIDRGYMQMFGETFDIDRKSTLEFTGSNPPDPVLSIGAGTKARKTGKQVDIRITGRASEPKVEFLVDEVATTAGDAVMAIMGGESSGDDDQNAAGQAGSFVAGVMASMMAVAARRELGAAAPIIMLEPGDDVASSRVRAGFELDVLIPPFMEDVVTGVYVEGIFGGDEGGGSVQGGVLLELYFPHSLVGSGQYGPGETWSVDLGWEP